MNTEISNRLTRIAVFFDGSYFINMSNYYHLQDRRKKNITLTGFHEYIRLKVSEREKRDIALCQIVESHFFRGRFSLRMAEERNDLKSDRYIDQLLMYAGIVPHYYPMNEKTDPPEEKGIDVGLSLEAYDLAIRKKFDVMVLVAGDQDYFPLMKKVNGVGARIMVIGMNKEWRFQDKRYYINMSMALIDEASYPIIFNKDIETQNPRIKTVMDYIFL